MGIIYKIKSPSNKVYIGQTINTLKARIKHHKQNSSNCTLLKRAINKYGDEMVYEILETVQNESLDEREIHWIKYYNSLAPNGYNCSTGGNSKKELSDLLKNKISNIQEKQISTFSDNIFPIEVEGTFDDCQKIVKDALIDKDFIVGILIIKLPF